MQLQVSSADTSLIQVEKDLRCKYSDTLSSSLALMQQQCKIEWINYGDECRRIFFAKAKQRKLASYIYQIKDADGNLIEGFDQVSSTMQTFHKSLLGEQNTTRKKIDMEVAHHRPVLGGCNSNLQQQCLQIIGLKNSGFPLTYLGVPIIASRLTKIECTSLVEKIIARVHLWTTRNISFVGRARLISHVIFGMFSYWASIFLLPNEVTEKITKICRNYLWSGTVDYKKAPYISWHHTYLPKSQGGIGIKDFAAWNKATIAKLT
ncbi:hypothetical protein Cgig2_021608 [Carnegiea gigantea]|uniref:Uncharacterized protein n=1 Tax=Carnegiea gigantea TaxID=171969 RepID=A0A9Q1JG33_9CARY|nr:hypothetical protein Cgig2_021608 [Carnegiea gigantea]